MRFLATAAAAVTVALAAGTAAAPAALAAPLATAPAASPMAFVGIDQGPMGGGQVYYRASATSPVVQLTNFTGGEYADEAVLMPNGQDVIVEGNFGGNLTNLERVNIATKAATIIPQSGPVANGVGKWGLSVSPDGTAVAFHGYLSAWQLDAEGIYVQKLDGSPEILVSPVHVFGQQLDVGGMTSWSHDGKYIAFGAGYGGSASWTGLAYAPATGGATPTVVVKSAPAGGGYQDAVWTPDDKGLLTWRWDPANIGTDAHLLYADVATGQVTPVLTDPGRVFATNQGPARISVDQHWTVYLSTYAPDSTSFARRIETAWLGDPGKITVLPSVTSDDHGATVSTAGPADPEPAGLPGAPIQDPKVILFELRGTRGSVTDTKPTDEVTNTFTKAVTDQLPGQVLPVPVDYGAIPIPDIKKVPLSALDFISHAYVDSEKDGVANLKRAVQHYQALYPHAWLAFVGYSAGAQVVRHVFADMPPAQQQQVAFLVTYGDPMFRPGKSYDRGSYDPALRGIYWTAMQVNPTPMPTPHVRVPRELAGRVQDWARWGDIVANWSWANARRYGYSEHVHYADTDYITRGASFAVQAVASARDYGNEVNRFGNGFDVYQQRQAANTPVVGWAATRADPATHFIRRPGTLLGAWQFDYAPNGAATGLSVADPGYDAAGTGLRDGLVLRGTNTRPWQQWYPQPDGTLRNAATGLIISPNGTGAQLRGTTAASPWGGSAYAWADYAHLP